ncbi:MAG TPA: YdcF family protein [Rhodocyclaceae bacterium]|nr:YdcF family protein [Rhodocyclaceae bacterium]
MSWLMTNFVATFLLPPMNGLVPAFIGLLLVWRRPRLGKTLIVLGLLMLAAFSTAIVADGLLEPLESRYPALAQESLRDLKVDAVVILAAGRYRKAPELGGGDDVRQLALDRLRYGALVARESGKPILVTGGNPDGYGIPEAEAMKISLARDFGVAARWVEGKSENTRQNAENSAEILLPQGIRRIALVTHAFHMPRSVPAFEAAGFEVVPAPTGFMGSRREPMLLDFIPRYDVMRTSGFALHELIGMLWYRLRR